jgi:GntR family transcriptional regulator
MQRATMAYNTAAQSLRERILAGVWQPGARLAPERDLCQKLGLSRITIRRALHILEEEGLIIRQQGRGTFVNPQPRRRIPIVNGDFSASVKRHAPELRRVVQKRQMQPAGADHAALLGVPPGDRVLYAQRVDFLNRTATATDEVVMPAVFADAIDADDLARIDFLEQLYVTHRLPLDYESQVVECLPAPALQAGILRVKKGVPLLKETNLVYLVGGRVAMLFISYYRHEYYQFKSVSRIASRNGLRVQAGGREV